MKVISISAESLVNEAKGRENVVFVKKNFQKVFEDKYYDLEKLFNKEGISYIFSNKAICESYNLFLDRIKILY